MSEDYEKYLAECLETTHGNDGALLGTEWCNMSAGSEQCQFVVRTGMGGYRCCALRKGHRDGHRDSCIGNQLPQSAWSERLS